MAQAKQDMGTGNIKKLMLQLMIPAVVAQVVNLLYNIVDRIYIGHIAGIGAAALTGVGLFTPILMLLNAFAMLVGAGGAPRTAIALGQGDKKQAEKIISNSFTMLLLFSVVLTIGFYAGAPVLLRLFGASDATLPYALSYSRIYIAGSVFVLVVLGMNPFITTQGFAKTSMLTTVIGAVINIILDPILIFGFGLGVRGAAIATVLSQAVGAAWIIRFLTGKKTILRLRRDYLRPEKQIILPVLALVLSIALGVAVGGAGSITFPLPALIWCAVRYPLPLTCLLTFLTGIGEILLVANSLIHFSPDARMQPWQLFSTRLGIAAMLISPVIVASSVEAINTLVKQLALRADFDFQTRVYSRSGLSEALKRQTLPADKLLTVMVLDIDGFKRVNDALGHEGGDCVLTQFAQQVRQLVGEQGMVARIGGEEFAVAAVVDSAQQGYLLAEKIRHGVESQPFGLGQNPIHLTISLGLETREVGHARITELFNQLLLAADDEMVKAKQSGRNQICMPTLTESAP